MTETVAVTYVTDEKAWSTALSEAATLETLQAVVAGWSPYVADAQAVVDQMDEADFMRWRKGLAKERRGRFAGEKFAKEFGALMLPENLIRGSEIANYFKAPLGCALIRMRDEGLLKPNGAA